MNTTLKNRIYKVRPSVKRIYRVRRTVIVTALKTGAESIKIYKYAIDAQFAFKEALMIFPEKLFTVELT